MSKIFYGLRANFEYECFGGVQQSYSRNIFNTIADAEADIERWRLHLIKSDNQRALYRIRPESIKFKVVDYALEEP